MPRTKNKEIKLIETDFNITCRLCGREFHSTNKKALIIRERMHMKKSHPGEKIKKIIESETNKSFLAGGVIVPFDYSTRSA